MAEHMQLPWIVKKIETTCGHCYKIGPQDIVEASHGAICLYDDNTSLNPHGEAVIQATAEFICRACNCHDELIAALKQAELSTAQIRMAADIGHKSAKDKVMWYVGQLEQLGREIRAALAAAERK